MYNKKYSLKSIKEFDQSNSLYSEIGPDDICYLAYLNPGERGWFLCDMGGKCPHNIHISTIKTVEYVEDQVIVVTRNTRFVFEIIND